MYIIKSNRLTRVIKYCKRTLQYICCNEFSFVFFYLLFLSFFLLYFFFKCRTRYFSSLNYTIVSTLSQLKKAKQKNKKLHTDIFHVLLKIIFLVVNASNLIRRISFERKMKNTIYKIYILAKVSHFLKNDKVKQQNTEILSFR